MSSKAPTSKGVKEAEETLLPPPFAHYLALRLKYDVPKRFNISAVHGLNLYKARLEDGKAFVTCEENYYDQENSQASIDRLRNRLGSLMATIGGAKAQVRSEQASIDGAKVAGLPEKVLAEVVSAHEAAIAQHRTILDPAEAEAESIEAEIAMYQARIDSRKTLEWVLELPE